VVTGEADDEDDDDEDDGGLGARGEAFTMDPAELDRDNQRRYLFREAVPPNHQNRYDAFNKVKLRTADVRRLVNATLSQSVPQNVVTVVGSYTKMFAGMLIESARQVQGEWLASNPTRADGEAQLAYKRLRMMQPESESESEDEDEDEDANADVDGGEPMEMDKDSPEKEQKTPNGATEQANPIADDTASQDEIDAKPVMNGDSPINGAASQPSINSLSAGTQDTIADGTPEKHKEKKTKESKPGEVLPDDFGYVQPGAWGLSKYVEECDRGPLQPDHLREALRRYKKSRSGGTVGFTGISLYGMENRDVAASRMGGRRLFK
jgi:transcription initiation factor TFIID subunit 11